jgi:hypothetical protein
VIPLTDSGSGEAAGGLPVRRRRLLALLALLAVLVLIPVLTYAVSSLTQARPTATVSIRILRGTTDPFVFPTAPGADVVNAEAALARSTEVLAGACRVFPQPPPDAIHLKACAAALGRRTFVSTEPASGSLEVRVRASSRQIAVTDANAMTRSLLATSAGYAAGQLSQATSRFRTAVGARARNTAASALVSLTRGLALQTAIRSATTANGSPLILTLVAAALALLISIALTRPRLPVAGTRGQQENEPGESEGQAALPIEAATR